MGFLVALIVKTGQVFMSCSHASYYGFTTYLLGCCSYNGAKVWKTGGIMSGEVPYFLFLLDK